MIRSVDGCGVARLAGPWAGFEVVHSDFRRAVAKSITAPAPASVRAGDLYVMVVLGHGTVQVNSLSGSTAGLTWSLAPNTYTPGSWGCSAVLYAYSPDDTPRAPAFVTTAGANYLLALASFVVRRVRAAAPVPDAVIAGITSTSPFSGPSATAAADAFCVAGVRQTVAATLALSAAAAADGWVLVGAEGGTAAMAAVYRIAPAGTVAGPEFTTTATSSTGAAVHAPFLHSP